MKHTIEECEKALESIRINCVLIDNITVIEEILDATWILQELIDDANDHCNCVELQAWQTDFIIGLIKHEIDRKNIIIRSATLGVVPASRALDAERNILAYNDLLDKLMSKKEKQ